MSGQSEVYDVLIIGAGIAGASVAYELAGTCRVLLLEREPEAGYHATGRSAALYVLPYGNQIVRTLTRSSLSFFQSPPSEFADAQLLAQRQCMYIARQDQISRLNDMANRERRLGYEFLPLPPEECVRRVPILRQDYAAGGLLDPAAMDIDVHGVHQGFLRGAKRKGVEIIKDAEVLDIRKHRGGYIVCTGTSEYETTVVVNAAGAWADTVARLAGVVPVGLRPLRRSAMILDPPAGIENMAWPFVVDVDEEFYFKPESGMILASPANETESAPCDAVPEELEVALCVDRLEKCTTLSIRRVARSWAGLRTFADDRSPVVGFDPAESSFFWLAGQGGFGVQTSPALGRVAAALVRRLPIPEDLSRLGLSAEKIAPGRSSL
ncbi:MAG: NAD(P)/FAD-dependent oxidoreductase [Steroidobacteraceae bacterium]